MLIHMEQNSLSSPLSGLTQTILHAKLYSFVVLKEYTQKNQVYPAEMYTNTNNGNFVSLLIPMPTKFII